MPDSYLCKCGRTVTPKYTRLAGREEYTGQNDRLSLQCECGDFSPSPPWWPTNGAINFAVSCADEVQAQFMAAAINALPALLDAYEHPKVNK